MNDLTAFIDRCWDDHASDAAGVALRLHGALDRVHDERELRALALLVTHVYGDHLAKWADGLELLAVLGRHPAFEPQGASGAQLRRARAALALAGDRGDARGTLSSSDAAAVTAQAACALALHDAPRARRLFAEAEAAVDAAQLADADPAQRALAVGGNNAATALAEQPALDDEARALMLEAAWIARRRWAKAGTWLETERADWRLADCALKVGDTALARTAAQACIDRVHAQPDAPAFERFFGHEALARAAAQAGDGAAAAQARAQAERAFAELGADDRAACRAALDALAAAVPNAAR